MRLCLFPIALLLLCSVCFAQVPALSFLTTSLPDGSTGVAYSQAVTAQNGTAPYGFTLISGSLPAGLSLSTGSPSATISGTPVTPQRASFTLQVSDSVGGIATQAFTILIAAGPLSIGTASPLTAGYTNIAYSQSMQANGGAPPYSWAVTAGTLPDGLSLSAAGALTGTPTTQGVSNFTITVTDSNSTAASVVYSLTVTLGTLSFKTPYTLPSSLYGTSYSQTIQAQGGSLPYNWVLTGGALPPGLSFNNGAITGTPTSPGTYTFTVQVFDNSSHYISGTFSLTIAGSSVTVATPGILPAGAVGGPYSTGLLATGGVPPYTWTVASGSLPPGLTLSTGGVISGVPTTVGSYIFSAQVQDNTSLTASQQFTITVSPAGISPRIGVFSQVVAGGGWTTTLWLVNRSAAAVPATIVFHADNGGLIGLPVTVLQGGMTTQVSANTLNETIAPNTTLVITTLPQTNNVQCWADVQGSGALSGFGFYSNGTSEAEVPLQSVIGTTLTLPFDNTNGNTTGIALVNLASSQASFTATIWDQTGNIVTTVPVTLTLADSAGNGHDSFMLPAKIASTANIRGIIQFSGNPGGNLNNPGQIAGLGLRVDSTGFTSMQTIVP